MMWRGDGHSPRRVARAPFMEHAAGSGIPPSSRIGGELPRLVDSCL